MKFRAQEQDLKSALYAVHPYQPEDEDQPTHYIVLYADLVGGEVEYNILDSNMMDLRLLAQIPKPVIIKLGLLYQQVLDWVDGKAPYPHSYHELPSIGVMETSDIGKERLGELQDREQAAIGLVEAVLNANDKSPT